MYKKIAIIGAGTWGTAIAELLSNKANVSLSHYQKKTLERLKVTKKHPHLPGYSISDDIRFSFDKTIEADLYIVAVPVQYIRSTISKFSLKSTSPILILSKGIERGSLSFPSDILKDLLGCNNCLAVLSGPSHAEQVIKKNPTTAVLCSSDKKLAYSLRDLFFERHFRVYCNSDMIGVQLGGAAKNVISIAAGISYGLGYKENTVSALVTRGLSEIKEIGDRLGARRETLNGLSGLGDLMGTAFSPKSRNRLVGKLLGKGMPLSKIVKDLGMIAEGIETSKSMYRLIKKLDVDAPICNNVYQIVYNNKNPNEAIFDLMTRSAKDED